MNTKPNDKAYPSHQGFEEAYPNYDARNQVSGGGLTKREYFAAMAMQGLIGKQWGHVDGSGDDEACAKLSVQYADALISELNKQ